MGQYNPANPVAPIKRRHALSQLVDRQESAIQRRRHLHDGCFGFYG